MIELCKNGGVSSSLSLSGSRGSMDVSSGALLELALSSGLFSKLAQADFFLLTFISLSTLSQALSMHSGLLLTIINVHETL